MEILRKTSTAIDRGAATSTLIIGKTVGSLSYNVAALGRSSMKYCSILSVAKKHGYIYPAIFVPQFKIDRICFVK